MYIYLYICTIFFRLSIICGSTPLLSTLQSRFTKLREVQALNPLDPDSLAASGLPWLVDPLKLGKPMGSHGKNHGKMDVNGPFLGCCPIFSVHRSVYFR